MRVRGNTVVLVNIYNVWRSPALDKRVPLGMLYLGDSLKKAGYFVKAYHFVEQEIDNYVGRIVSDGPLFVAVTSIMTGFSLRAAMQFSKTLKSKHSDIPVVWGGVQPSAIPEVVLKESYVDGVGIGEGEETIVEIAKAYQGMMEFSGIKGFAYKNGAHDVVINEERSLIKDLDGVSPDYSLINLHDYMFQDGYVTGLAMSSRGCPFDCSFCYNNSFNARRWRPHSGEFVVKSILELKKKYSFSKISFSDDNLLVNKPRAFWILDQLCKAGIRVYSIDLRIRGLSEEDIDRLEEYKVISVFFGTESLNRRLLDLIQKEHSKADVINGLRKLDKHPNINVQSEILIGLPFESREEMIQDIRDGLTLYNYHRNLSLYFGTLFPLPKTRMFEYAKANGFNPSSLRDYAEIDLNNAWKICDGWVPWADKCAKRQLFWTEKFSEIISLSRVNRGGIIRRIFHFSNVIQFHVAKFRLARQFFTGAQIDFLVYETKHRIKTFVALLPKAARNILSPVLSIDQRVNYRNFGYIPTGSISDVAGKLFGHQNLLKRLQAVDIMKALNVGPGDILLDFGCGNGYMTVEMAKLGKRTYGIDVTNYIETIHIPDELKGRLEFIKTSGAKLPFEDSFFDRILASEILPMIPDPTEFLSEISRVLKPGGLLVIVNGGGHPAIKEGFERRSLLLRILGKIYSGRMPNSYEAYCSTLQNLFKTAQDHFLEEQEIRDLLHKCNFCGESMDYTPGHWTGVYLSWSQFVLYLKTGKALSQRGFLLNYLLFTVLRGHEKRKYRGGIVCVARKRGDSAE